MRDLPAPVGAPEAQGQTIPQRRLLAVLLLAREMRECRGEGDVAAHRNVEVFEDETELPFPRGKPRIKTSRVCIRSLQGRCQREDDAILCAVCENAGGILPAQRLGPVPDDTPDLRYGRSPVFGDSHGQILLLEF